MSQTDQAEHIFGFIAGNLSVDFTNTVSDRKEALPHEHLTDYASLVAWGRQAGVLTPAEAARLRVQGAAQPEDATAVVAGARALREALYRMFVAVIAERPAAVADLAILNTALARTLAQARLVRAEAGLGWGWAPDLALDRMLWPVARGAAELFTTPEIQRVSECMSADCGWLFLDLSRNHSRHWCSMDGCGNRAKARRHYTRIQQPRPTPAT